MSEQFENIVVARFEAGEADQDPQHKGVFRFQFMLSRPAPDLWVQIADAELGKGQRANWNIRHTGRAYSDRIVIGCIAQEAQQVKDALNEHVLPTVNQDYRRRSGAAQAQKAAEAAQQQGILSDIEKAVRDQK
jgi:hypothetical protein